MCEMNEATAAIFYENKQKLRSHEFWQQIDTLLNENGVCQSVKSFFLKKNILIFFGGTRK